MIIQCDQCHSKFKLDESAIKSRGVKVKCTRCQNIFIVALAGADKPEPGPEPVKEETPREAAPPAPEETGKIK